MNSDLSLVERRGRLPDLHRVVRRGQLRASRVRRPSCRGPGAARSRDSRRERGSRFGVRRVAHLRRFFVAGAHQPPVRRGGARSRYERAADDRAARHAGDHVQAAWLPRRRRHARDVAGLAGGGLLRIRRDLWRRTARLPRPSVRVVGHDGSVRPRPDGRARSEPRATRAAVRLFPDDQHPHSVYADAPVPAGLGPRAHRRSVRRERT